MKEKLKQKKGITLIALVVTIVILIILAGVSINLVLGENGIIQKAKEAKTETAYKSAEEKVKLAIMGTRADDGEMTLEELKTEVTKYKGSVTGTAFPVEVQMEGHTFKVDEKGNVTGNKPPQEGEQTGEEATTTTESYVGYYADIDGKDGVDGVIYADLAKGNTKSGQWTDSNGEYTIPVETGLKEYVISKKDHVGPFGTKDVIKPKEGTTGKDRFYVMALENVGLNTRYTWYNAAHDPNTGSGTMSDYATATSGNFGTGKTNTSTMMEKWKTKAYGEQDTNSTYKDVWGQITEEVAKGWFVPSRAEWAAFAEELGINETNYGNFGLIHWYWSSSQNYTIGAWRAHFYTGCMDFCLANNNCYVRLSATF